MIADRIRSIQAVSGGGGGATDPYYAYRSLILNFDGNFNDSSPNALAVTDYGDAQIVGDGTFGTVASFDGNGDVLTVAGGSHFNFGSGNFTIECWIKSSQTQQGYAGIFSRSADAAGAARYLFSFDGSGVGLNLWVNAVSNSSPRATHSTNINDGNWHHIAAVRSSTSYTIYVDGVAGASSASAGTIADSTDVAHIATDANFGTTGTSRKFVGEIGPLRISPWAEYTSPFTPSQDLFPASQGYPAYDPRNALLLNMQGTAGTATFVDESPNAFTVTRVGDAVLVSDATFGTVASFDGTGDYLQTDAASCFAGTQDFTVEFWLYWDAVPTADTAIIGALSSGGSSIGIFNYNKDFGILKTGGGTFANFGSKSQLTAGQWNHVAVTRSGSSHRCFINGILSSSGVVTSSADWGTPTTCWIGRQGHATIHNYLAGKIGPLRITKGVARYTSNFTPPTGLFPTS